MKLVFYYSNVFAAVPVVVAKAPNIVASTHLMYSFTLVLQWNLDLTNLYTVKTVLSWHRFKRTPSIKRTAAEVPKFISLIYFKWNLY